MRKAASAASPSASPRAWSRAPRPARCASATTHIATCAACSRLSASADQRQGPRRTRRHLSRSARKAARVSRRQPRHRGRRYPNGRARRRARCLRDAIRRVIDERRLVAVTVVARPASARAGCCTNSRTGPSRARSRSRLPGPRQSADARPAVRLAARHSRMAAADRRQRQHDARPAKARTRHRAAVREPTMARHGRGPCPSARSSHRTRLRRQPAHRGHPRRRASRSAIAHSMRRRR